jgi:transposase-like protein
VQCAACGHQESVTAGTVFHRTRTPLRKWFLAAYLMMRDKRGISATMLARELAVRYETAWLMAHKLRCCLGERAKDFLLHGDVEVDETVYGGRSRSLRGDNLGRSTVIVAVERRPAPCNRAGVKQSGYVAGNARAHVLTRVQGRDLRDFVGRNVRARSTVVTDGRHGYRRLAGRKYRHDGTVLDSPQAAGRVLPVVHILFTNMKAWLNGTFHGVSPRHLPLYLREWTYRFNRRHRPEDLVALMIKRAMRNPPRTLHQIIHGPTPIGR